MELHKCVFLLHKYYFVGGYFYLVVFRVMKMAGEEGTLTKENFIKILRSSDLFLKAFDKNKDGIVPQPELGNNEYGMVYRKPTDEEQAAMDAHWE